MAFSTDRTVLLQVLAILCAFHIVCAFHIAQGGKATSTEEAEHDDVEPAALRWGAWSECTKDCGTGRQTRVETCLKPSEECSRGREEIRSCAATSQACADSAILESVVVKSIPKAERSHVRHFFVYLTTLGVLTTTVVVLLLLIWYHMVRMSNNRREAVKQDFSDVGLDRYAP